METYCDTSVVLRLGYWSGVRMVIVVVKMGLGSLCLLNGRHGGLAILA